MKQPPREPEYVICKRCAGSQSVPNPVVSNTAYTTCPKCGGRGYEIKPETAKEQFEVGDWVEFNPGNNPKQVEIVEIDGDKLYYNTRYAGKTIKTHIYASAITRKLDPSEVVVDFGSGIKGTIVGCSNVVPIVKVINGIDWIASIMITALDAPTREMVERCLRRRRRNEKQ